MTAKDLSVVFLKQRPAAPGLLSAAWRVTRLSPLHVLRGKRLIALLVLVALPPLLIVTLRIFGSRDGLSATVFKDIVDAFYVNAIFPLVALFLGAAAMGDDIDDGTVLYLRLRPIPRAAIVIGRYLAATASCLALFLLSLFALYAVQVGGMEGEFFTRYSRLLFGAMAAAGLAAMTFTALFLLLGLLLRRAVIVGIVILLVQGLLLMVEGPIAWASTHLHLFNVLTEYSAATDARLETLNRLEEVGLLPTIQESCLGLAIASLVLLVGACVIFARREYVEKPGD